MQPREQPPAEQPESVGRIAAALSVWRALGATVLLSALIAGLLYFRSPPPPAGAIGDAVTQSEASARAASFAALGSLSLAGVPAPAILAAVDDMGLSPMEKDALLRTLSAASDAGPRTEPAAQPTAVAEPNKVGVPSVAAAPNAAAAPSATAQPQRLRLAWITLWDTDVEDGDAVRIDSAGYSRTVTLAKQPVTFAVPVPASGVIQITGVRDGEGGGITVGLASGSARAVFPVMSVGQTLGLNVRLGP
jgi:hypothetical protein